MNKGLSGFKTVRFIVLLGLLRSIALFPLPILYIFSDVLRIALQHVVRYRRDVVRENLSRVFPNQGDAFRREVESKFYRHLCDSIFETIKLLHISDEELRRRIEISGVETLRTILDKEVPVMAMLGHYGNWEWVQELKNRLGPQYVVGEIYRPIGNAVANQIMSEVRSRWDTRLIDQKSAVRTILRMKQSKQKFVIGFIADQRPNGVVLDNWASFLGQNTPYANGAEVIGRKIGAKYVFIDVQQPRRGYYQMDIRPLDIDDMQAVKFPYTIRYLRELERSILKRPEFWLWSHKRWSIPHYSKISSSTIV